jgi:hypothetical protein
MSSGFRVTRSAFLKESRGPNSGTGFTLRQRGTRNAERGIPWRGLLCTALLLAAATGCGDEESGPARTFRMGFSPIPPKLDTTLLFQVLTLTAQHSDAGLVQLGIPWTVLLADTAAATEVRIVRLPLVQFYRANGKAVTVALDVTDGLNRAAEAPELVALGRSITDTAVQRRYREYVAAVDSILQPDYLSLAAETNLIRLAAPAPVYQAMVTMVNAAAAERAAQSSTTPLMVSVQVETAWGGLQGGAGFQGIDQDLADFPFVTALGLSSYPFLGGYPTPESIPIEYYQRLVAGTGLTPVVLEGGWPSQGFNSSPEMQARYLARQAQILNRARGSVLYQITFTDLDPNLAPGIGPFANLGLVDTLLNPKPALAVWDSVLGLPRR